jgi:hypothetical protein
LEKVPWAAEKNVYCVEVAGPFDLLYILDLGFLY